jgi:hypothetical protein
MATFSSDIGGEPARAPRFGGTISRVATFTVPSGVTTADDVDMFTIPAGATLVDMWATNVGSGTATVDIGTADNDDQFIAAAARNTTVTRISLASGINTDLSTETLVKAVFNANPDAGNVVTVGASYVLTA